MRILPAAAGLLIAGSSWTALPQQIDLGAGSASSVSHRQHVEVLSDALTVQAGKLQDIEVRFRVDPGFHINSHQPKDELLIPTALKLEEIVGLKIVSEEYPKGAAFQLAIGSETETLDVYTGEFRVALRVIAPRGVSSINGILRYQACDNAACFPPRNLPVSVTVTGK